MKKILLYLISVVFIVFWGLVSVVALTQVFCHGIFNVYIWILFIIITTFFIYAIIRKEKPMIKSNLKTGFNYLHRHPQMEQSLNVDAKHVIVDRKDWEEVVNYFHQYPEKVKGLGK